MKKWNDGFNSVTQRKVDDILGKFKVKDDAEEM